VGDERSEVARLLTLSAAELEHRGIPLAPIVRRGARTLVEVLAELDALRPDQAEQPCPTCGAEVTQPPTGRRRRYCSDRCRHRAAKQQRKTRS
jgi:hypothetical protein